MEYGLLSHRAALNECYALDKDHLEIEIKTGYGVTEVFLCYGDPYSAGIMGGAEKWSGEKTRMHMERELEYQRVWSIVVEPSYKRCKYYFEIHENEECVYLFEDGIYTKERMEIPGRKEQCFFFPWINPADIDETPDWVADTIWYQIFPDRFCNGDRTRDPWYVKEWKSEKVQHLDVYGGDLRGIRMKLPYLKELGITGIYLTPIFASISNHKYNTTDYYRVDEAFGDEEELRQLVDEAHEMGIRIMLDAVFNHCGEQFAPWQDVLEKGPASKYYDWFFIHQWPFDAKNHSTRDGRYDSFAFEGEMPKLNTNHPEVIAYFKELCSYWLREWHIDGIRFDVGNEVSHRFLKELRLELKKINPEVFLLGEIWHDSIAWLMGDEYDSVMNYPFVESINDFFIDESRRAVQFAHSIDRCYSLYMKQTNRVLFNLLDSHDTERLITRVGSLGKFYEQLVLLFTMEGSPCIYYGTEIALEGSFDPDCRRCMPWEEIEDGKWKERIEAVKALIRMRKNYKACRSAETKWIFAPDNDRVIGYRKDMPGEVSIEVKMNASREKVEMPDDKKIIFSYGCEDGWILADGVCVYEA